MKALGPRISIVLVQHNFEDGLLAYIKSYNILCRNIWIWLIQIILNLNWLAQWECFCSYLQFSWLNTITGSTLLRIAPGYVDCSLLLTVLNNSGTVLLTQERIASFLLVKHSIPSSAINTVYFKKTKLLETSSNTWRCMW